MVPVSNIKPFIKGTAGYEKRIEATFVQTLFSKSRGVFVFNAIPGSL